MTTYTRERLKKEAKDPVNITLIFFCVVSIVLIFTQYFKHYFF